MECMRYRIKMIWEYDNLFTVYDIIKTHILYIQSIHTDSIYMLTLTIIIQYNDDLSSCHNGEVFCGYSATINVL